MGAPFSTSAGRLKDLQQNTTVIVWSGARVTMTVRKAIDREKQLKGWTRAKKIALIESKNSRWEDWAEKWGTEMLFANQSIKNKLSS
jgi:hypothetical protein